MPYATAIAVKSIEVTTPKAVLEEVRIPPSTADAGKKYPIYGKAHNETGMENFAIGISNYSDSASSIFVYDEMGVRHEIPPGQGIARIVWGWSDKCKRLLLDFRYIQFPVGGRFRGCIWTGYIKERRIYVTDHKGWITNVKAPPRPPPPPPPRRPPWWERIVDYLPWILLGLGVAVVTGMVVYRRGE